MTLHRIGTQGLISIAFIIPTALVLSFCEAKAQSPNAVELAAAYGVDKVLCDIEVPRPMVNAALVQASLDTRLNVWDVTKVAGEIGTAIIGNLKDNGRVGEYCSKRARAY